MRTTVHEEANRIVKPKVVVDSEEAVVDMQSSETSFSETVGEHAVFTAVVQSHDLKALVWRCEQHEDGRVAHIHVLRVPETEFHGSGGVSTCIKNINSRTFPGKQDPRFFV